ncbi:hypothetical protein Ancab_023270 [Ancistrocladus abbreviatus]
MATSEKDLEEQLMEAGNRLLSPLPLVDELLPLLDQIESCLTKVEQLPSESMQKALSPSRKALVADALLRHSDLDVKVAVAACISEITRITAPHAPYEDDQIKEVFQLIVSSFEKLYDDSSRSYYKRVLILETMAKVRSCVVMLDLECDALIVEMFQHFLRSVRDYHPENVFTSMETIMTLVLEESGNIPLELVSSILQCLKRENQEVLPIARKLGAEVLENCATKLKPYLAQAVKSMGIPLDGYSEVVARICPALASDDGNAISENLESGAEEYGEELVGSMINVWWPNDREFYVGKVESFNAVDMTHKVVYTDGDVEVLLLKHEIWKFIDDDKVSHKGDASDGESPVASYEMMGDSKSYGTCGTSKNERYWTLDEVRTLVECLHELSTDPTWKAENDFKNGYLVRLEEMLHQKCPNCGLKAYPHIDSKLRDLKKKYDAIAEMLNKFGFTWDELRMMLQVDKKGYDNWCKSHDNARGPWGVPFPHFHVLAEIYGNDRATSDDVVVNIEREMENQKKAHESFSISDDGVSMTQESAQATTSSKQAKKQKSGKGKQARGRESKEMEDARGMTSSFNDLSTKFGNFIQDMNSHLATMANALSQTQAREQEMADKSNRIVSELLQLEGITQMDAMQAATLLIAEPNKLIVFYQLPTELRSSYVLSILHPDGRGGGVVVVDRFSFFQSN